MLRFIFALKVFCCMFLCSAKGDCDYPFEEGRLIFSQSTGPFHILLPGISSLPENQEIEAYCGGAFEVLTRYYGDESPTDQSFKFKCSSNTFHMWHPQHGFYKYGNIQIKCPKEMQITYTYPINGCQKDSLIKADRFGEIKVVYAEICYDMKPRKLDFVHFVVADRSPILENQEQYIPSQAVILDDNDNFISLPTFFAFKARIRSTNTSEPLYLSSPVTKYSKHSLLPSDNFSPYLRNPNLGPEVEILWWMPLKERNWNIYEKLAKKLSRSVDLDIYAGVSHDIWFKGSDKCMLMDLLDLELKGLEEAAPLYIWNYVKERNNSQDEGFVIIGLNIPFYDVSKSYHIDICTDMCDTIDWLKPLEVTRKMPVLGYIFCCNVADAKDKLFGFPIATNFSAVERTTTELSFGTEPPRL